MKFEILLIVVVVLPPRICNLGLPTMFDDLSAVNAFSDCTTRLINFKGLNINIPILSHPIVHLRYFAFPDVNALYPFEWKMPNALNYAEWILEMMNWSRFNTEELESIHINICHEHF